MNEIDVKKELLSCTQSIFRLN